MWCLLDPSSITAPLQSPLGLAQFCWLSAEKLQQLGWKHEVHTYFEPGWRGQANPALQVSSGLIPVNANAQSVPSFCCWQFEMKLNPLTFPLCVNLYGTKHNSIVAIQPSALTDSLYFLLWF
jgi:hypothetical protein